MHSAKFECVLDAPLVHCLALAMESDMHPFWNRFVADSCTLTRPSAWEQLVYVAAWAPYPFPVFDTVFRGRAFDLGEVRPYAFVLYLAHQPLNCGWHCGFH